MRDFPKESVQKAPVSSTWDPKIPLDEGDCPPRAWYAEQEVFDLEKKSVFSNKWQPVGKARGMSVEILNIMDRRCCRLIGISGGKRRSCRHSKDQGYSIAITETSMGMVVDLWSFRGIGSQASLGGSIAPLFHRVVQLFLYDYLTSVNVPMLLDVPALSSLDQKELDRADCACMRSIRQCILYCFVRRRVRPFWTPCRS
jgi:hypothetical protein